LIIIAVPGDTRVDKEQEKVDKYQNLARELKRFWKMNTNSGRCARNNTKKPGEKS